MREMSLGFCILSIADGEDGFWRSGGDETAPRADLVLLSRQGCVFLVDT